MPSSPSSLLPPQTSPLRRAAAAVLRSPVGTVLDSLTAPHGIDRYLELLDPMLARDTTRAVVTAVHSETPDTTTLTLRPNRWSGHVAGQHVNLTVEIDGRRHLRCYSVSSSEHRSDGHITITVKADPEGRVSGHLAHEVTVGTVLGLTQAFGDVTLPRERPEQLFLVSGGSGVTPVMSMLRTLVDEDAATDITFLHYARTTDDVTFADELAELDARRRNLQVVTILTGPGEANGPHGLTGHLTADHVDVLLGQHAAVPTYVCGPSGLIDAALGLWAAAGIDDLLHVERFQPASRVDADAGASGTIAFAGTSTSVANDGRTLLDQAEAAGLRPQSGCRMGICHTCIVPKITGQVRDTRDGRLSTCDPEAVQICISVPVGDVTIDL